MSLNSIVEFSPNFSSTSEKFTLQKSRKAFVTLDREIITSPAFQKLSGTGAKLLMVLKSYSDIDNKPCYPSNETLATNMGCSLATVKRALNELKKAGLIATDARRTISFTSPALEFPHFKSEPLQKLKSEPRPRAKVIHHQLKNEPPKAQNCGAKPPAKPVPEHDSETLITTTNKNYITRTNEQEGKLVSSLVELQEGRGEREQLLSSLTGIDHIGDLNKMVHMHPKTTSLEYLTAMKLHLNTSTDIRRPDLWVKWAIETGQFQPSSKEKLVAKRKSSYNSIPKPAQTDNQITMEVPEMTREEILKRIPEKHRHKVGIHKPGYLCQCGHNEWYQSGYGLIMGQIRWLCAKCHPSRASSVAEHTVIELADVG